MPENARSHTSGSANFRWGLAAALLTAVFYLPSLFWTFGHDQNVFAEIGALILKGKLPYIDAWDIKPPNIFYLYALAECIGGQHEIAIRALEYLSTILTSVLLFIFVLRWLHERSDRREIALATSFLFAITVLTLGLADTAQTESFSLPCIVAAMMLWIRRSSKGQFFAGLVLATATFFKTTNALFLLPFIVDAMFFQRNRRFKNIASLSVGFLIGAGCEILFMAWQGFLHEYLSITASVLFLHVGKEFAGENWNPIRVIWIYLGMFSFMGLVGLTQTIRRHPSHAELRFLYFLTLLSITGVVAVAVQQKGWGYHNVILLPGLIPLAAYGTYRFAEWISARFAPKKSSQNWVIGSIFILLAIAPPTIMRRGHEALDGYKSLVGHEKYIGSLGTLRGVYYPAATKALSDYVRSHTSATDSIFILGQEPGAYWQSQRTPASRYIYTLLFTSPMMTDTMFNELNNVLLLHTPRLIVIERYDTLAFSGTPMTSETLLQTTHFASLRNLLAAHYALTDTISQKFLIYSRRDL